MNNPAAIMIVSIVYSLIIRFMFRKLPADIENFYHRRPPAFWHNKSRMSIFNRLLPKSCGLIYTICEPLSQLGQQGDEAFSEMPGGRALSFRG
jgi:hypothetical protein